MGTIPSHRDGEQSRGKLPDTCPSWSSQVQLLAPHGCSNSAWLYSMELEKNSVVSRRQTDRQAQTCSSPYHHWIGTEGTLPRDIIKWFQQPHRTAIQLLLMVHRASPDLLSCPTVDSPQQPGFCSLVRLTRTLLLPGCLIPPPPWLSLNCIALCSA